MARGACQPRLKSSLETVMYCSERSGGGTWEVLLTATARVLSSRKIKPQTSRPEAPRGWKYSWFTLNTAERERFQMPSKCDMGMIIKV